MVLFVAVSCGTQDDPATVTLADLGTNADPALDFESLGLKSNNNSNNKKQDDDKKKKEEEKRKKDEEDKRKKAEDDKRKKAEDEKRRKDEEDKRKKVEEDKRKAENNKNQNNTPAKPTPTPTPTPIVINKASIAFGSVVKLEISGSGKSCKGGYAYEDLKNGYAQVYLYTSAHCFEKRDPLGARRQRSTDSVLQVTAPVNPFQGQSTSYMLTVPKREIFQYTGNQYDDSQADIVRIPKELITLDKASKNYLPICTGTGQNAVNFHAMLMSAGSLYVQPTPYSLTEPYVPKSLQKILNAGSPQPFKIARGVEARPGDSGSPVFLTSLSSSTVTYSCVFGLVTREVWRLDNPSCDGKSCRMKGEAVFEAIKDEVTSAGRWVSW
ncbi:MAG: hypothetical protein EBR09_16605 [Proteobacteria bacterium]|nr:hypothetical protein [Pseudomonadota bacterium]